MDGLIHGKSHQQMDDKNRGTPIVGNSLINLEIINFLGLLPVNYLLLENPYCNHQPTGVDRLDAELLGSRLGQFWRRNVHPGDLGALKPMVSHWFTMVYYGLIWLDRGDNGTMIG